MRLTEMKVPGRKIVVKTAMIFMAELSRFAAAASFLESRAISKLAAPSWRESWASLILAAASCCAIRLNSCKNIITSCLCLQ